MTIEEFCGLTVTQLAAITGIDKSQWSRCFQDKQLISERTLRKVSPMLGMTPLRLFEAIEAKRDREYRKVDISPNLV